MSASRKDIAAAYPRVKCAAVVGVYHPKWEERPILLIEPHVGEAVTPDEVRSFLADRVVKWWLPDAILIGPIPLTATGKIDKKVIRERYRDQLIEAQPQVR